MLTTAKNMQLLDASGINISPMTDITSLYYEVEELRENNNNSSIITRKFVYSGFPVSVQFDDNIINDVSIDYVYNQPYDSCIDSPFYKIKTQNGEDIIISNVSTNIIPGTTYRQININNYNLTNILYNYATRDMMDASILALDSSLLYNENRINELYDSIALDSFSLDELLSNGVIIPNKFYLINDYYSGLLGGCMDDFILKAKGPEENDKKILLVRAGSTSRLDGIIYGMYNADGTSLMKNGEEIKINGNYIITNKNNKNYLRIVKLKDCLNNEANYDLYNLMFTDDNDSYHYTFSKNNQNAILDDGCNIINNNIKLNPYDNDNIFFNHVKGGIIQYVNNIIGDSTITLIAQDSNNTGELILHDIKYVNNIINNNNKIIIKNSNSNVELENSVIGNNNAITINGDKQIDKILNTIIGNNNNIIFEVSLRDVALLNNFIIETNNDIHFKFSGSNQYSNVVIKNNCNCSVPLGIGESTLNNNVNLILDNYINTNETFYDTKNSAYLFAQNIYAYSFNAFK